ncbi:DVUA0089 family protein [Sphingomonas flavalba]|uniref:DVUA0089 family protein n=1 Tax=Sphingomonas flavalba TaxID=2559804 RepID=UPI00109E25F7|nr:DVUA0089 family protein [Sphingomonas flavalba]
MSRIKARFAALLATAAFAATPAAAVDLSFVGTLPAENGVAFIDFSLNAAGSVTLASYGYAGGTNAAGQTIAAGGFDSILTLFDKTTGARIAQNDDRNGWGAIAYDPLLTLNLAAGSYTAALSSFTNFSMGPNLAYGFTDFGLFFGRSGNWALDISGDTLVAPAIRANTAPVAVPEPAAWALMIAGFGLAGYAFRRRRGTVRFA